MKKTKGFLLASSQSGVGKTTLSIGIMGALKKKAFKVKPFKVGPDYIDPQFHKFITGNPSRNLDSYMLGENTIKNLFQKNLQAGDIAVVEGVMGLYDGYGTKKDEGSSAHIAKLLNLPVILVIDGSGTSTSAAAMVLGYKLYDQKVKIKGVIINNLSGQQHYQLIKEAIERDTGIKCIGYLKKNEKIQLKSRHLGLIPCKEVPKLKETIEEIVNMVEETIDVEALLDLAGDINLKKINPKEENKETYGKNLTIAYAYDEAFNFYYEDNLQLLKEMGCQLIPFSPLRDKKLPQGIHGIYIGGGFPEVFAKELEENQGLRNNILQEAVGGMPIYGECGGFMYLTKGIKTFDGQYYEMVSLFDAVAEMTDKLQNFGYCQVEVKEESKFFENPFSIKAHEFHRGIVKNKEKNYVYHIKKIKEEKIIKKWNCGIEKYNSLGAFPHIHFYSNLDFIKSFLKKSNNYRDFKELER